MATISTNQTLDSAPRTAGEAFTINTNARLTIDTDTRWHANAPASMTGSTGNLIITDGELYIDATAVRWMAYDTGSGNVPAIGTSITQAGVSASYLLAVYASLTAAPTAVGASMPPTGYLKFKSVTGAFVAGALTGIGANATGADVRGWLEVATDSAATITVPRLGKFKTRGDWFYLDNTNGSVGQTLQVPTNGGGAGTFCPGVWIETSPGLDEYEYWPAVTTASGWTRTDLGAAYGETDARQNFVKNSGDGVMQIGEASDLAATYASIAPIAATYSALTSQASTYTWANDLVTITYTTGHLMKTGHRLWLDFTSGGATGSDGAYTIVEVIDVYTYTVALLGSGTGGNVTGYLGLNITYTGHLLSTEEIIYCDFTSGTGVDGNYRIFAQSSTTVLFVEYPLAPPTSGNVSVHSKYKISCLAHGLGWGHRVYLDFTSGAGTDGIYTIIYPTAHGLLRTGTYTWAANVVTVTFTAHGYNPGTDVYLDFTSGAGTPDGVYTVVTAAANTFTVALTGSGTGGNCTIQTASFEIIANNGTAGDSGNVTIKQTIGNIPPSGCKVRIPNIFLRECETATRATNIVNATVASRPEFDTVSAGSIDTEYLYSSWYHNYAQAYSLKQYYHATFDTTLISEIATALDVNELGISFPAASAVSVLTLSYCGAGGTFSKFKGFRGNIVSGASYGLSIVACVGITFTDFSCGFLLREVMSAPYSASIASLIDCTFINLRTFQDFAYMPYNINVKIYNWDYCNQFVGYTNSKSSSIMMNPLAGVNRFFVDGISFGYGFTIPNQHPYANIVSISNVKEVVLRNIGTYTSRVSGGSWRAGLYGLGTIYAPTALTLDVGVKYQRMFFNENGLRLNAYNSQNNDSEIVTQNITASQTLVSGLMLRGSDGGVNSITRGILVGDYSANGVASVYDNSFKDYFLGKYNGKYLLAFNEPTSLTNQYYTVVSGTPRFNGAGGLLMSVAGDQIIWEDQYFHLGHTGFKNVAPVIGGGTLASFTYEYDIDFGSGFAGSWTTLNGTNLSAITVDPAIGFRMKYRITTVTPGSAAITFLVIETTSSASAQENNLYPLDDIEATYTGFSLGTRLQVYDLQADREVYNGVPATTSYSCKIPLTVAINAVQQVRIRAMYIDGDEAKMFYEATDNFTYTINNVYDGLRRQIDMVDDAVYNENAIDGSTVTGITINDTNLLVNIDEGDNTISWAEIYAYESYWLTTEAGIRDEGRFIEAVDPVNYTIYGFKIKNISSPSLPLEITGGYGVDSVTLKSITLIDNTGGTIFNSPDHIVKYKPELTATDVWANSTRTLTGIGTSGIAAEASLISATDVWSSVLEGAYTAQDLVRIAAAISAGKTTITPVGPGQVTVAFRDVSDASTIVTGSMDNSERVSVTLNV
jgi:hypothetical protein